jgi:hypothetical protein
LNSSQFESKSIEPIKRDKEGYSKPQIDKKVIKSTDQNIKKFFNSNSNSNSKKTTDNNDEIILLSDDEDSVDKCPICFKNISKSIIESHVNSHF